MIKYNPGKVGDKDQLEYHETGKVDDNRLKTGKFGGNRL